MPARRLHLIQSIDDARDARWIEWRVATVKNESGSGANFIRRRPVSVTGDIGDSPGNLCVTCTRPLEIMKKLSPLAPWRTMYVPAG